MSRHNAQLQPRERRLHGTLVRVDNSALRGRLHADPADIAFKEREAEQHGAVFPPGGVSTEFLAPVRPTA